MTDELINEIHKIGDKLYEELTTRYPENDDIIETTIALLKYDIIKKIKEKM